MDIPAPYKLLAQGIYDTFWTRAIEKQGHPLLSKGQIRAQITLAVAEKQAEDGDPSTWVDCTHCEDGIYYTRPIEIEQRAPDFLDKVSATGLISRGVCFQCGGKSMVSPADRRRNWGYQQRHEER
jgi:hypothetical protein